MQRQKRSAAILVALFIQSGSSFAEESNTSTLDSISITATKLERESKSVPQSVSVVDEADIERENPININDVIDAIPGVQAISKNNGYDSRLIIRGAGLKAPYGVREIMVIRDGVPMTDPDSFTRFDMIDIDDMEGVEIYKGPGSIYASNATGGVVFIKSKSVFDDQQDRIKLGIGSFNSLSFNAKKSLNAGENDSFAINLSRRQSNNDWRDWNEFDTTQFSLKHGHFFEDDSVLETEIAYTEANLQLPQSLSADEFEAYKNSGETTNTNGDWQKSGRYSTMLFMNSRYETTLGAYTFKPQVYFTQWGHFHPVTGMINDAQDNKVIGTDLAWNRKHTLFGNSAEFLFGLTARTDIRENGKKYTYEDMDPDTGVVLSDDKGDLAQTEDSQSTILGAYIQDSFSPSENLLIDMGLRYDQVDMSIDGTQILAYNWGSGSYIPGSGDYSYDETYHLFSPKIGLTYALNDSLNVYGLIASSNQAPTESEMQATRDNAPEVDLNASTATNFEIGLKHRSKAWSADLAVYFTKLHDEIVKVENGYADYYENAGETDKKGIELTAAYQLNSQWGVGFSGSKTEYRYVDYLSGDSDYSGNLLRFSPEYQYSLFADWHKGAYRARLETIGVGEYYMDDANSEKYSGYAGVTNLTMGYARNGHQLALSVHNIGDQRYASEVSKTASSWGPDSYYYTPGAPRTLKLSYQYKY
ncbi:TonB-dependent receptor [Thiomicrorhabdus sp. zzn3]|uniref:TonB-dependent receptor n=1 Tax=Thiomicrorhabdus sp. zzn3 TaxID=3039775 RepID=UPI0024373F80|nr:TonB-dependent receptor [Thiomicrorhabdus sp. zzn3]MDG6778728.1 TonB-dependent receptor [Thiomicrorhabdus sp. zzn3]